MGSSPKLDPCARVVPCWDAARIDQHADRSHFTSFALIPELLYKYCRSQLDLQSGVMRAVFAASVQKWNIKNWRISTKIALSASARYQYLPNQHESHLLFKVYILAPRSGSDKVFEEVLRDMEKVELCASLKVWNFFLSSILIWEEMWLYILIAPYWICNIGEKKQKSDQNSQSYISAKFA
jgi:hypothetical protein